MAAAASSDGVPVFKFPGWRRKGVVKPEVLQQYQSVGAELNVMPYCSQFIPLEVVNYPKVKATLINSFLYSYNLSTPRYVSTPRCCPDTEEPAPSPGLL